MKHNVILQGKKYISSKRASKISDYSSDYIGQLCREGKLDAKMVGRAWFVDEDSLRFHMARVSAPEAFTDRALNFSRSLISQDESDDRSKLISAKAAADATGYSADYISQLCRARKLEAKMIGNVWFVAEDSLHAYVQRVERERQDAEMRKLSRRSYESRKRTSYGRYSTVSRSQAVSAHRPQPLRRTFATLAMVLFLIGAVSMSLVYFSGKPNVAVNHSSVAGVYSAAQAVADFMRRSFDALLALIAEGRRGLTMITSSQEDTVGGKYGIVVAPSSDRNELLKQEVKRNFSDTVDVAPDKSGTAGIITPVFRSSSGDDFMYVLVPIKEEKANSP